MASVFVEANFCMVPGPKYSSLQMGNDPSGQRMFVSFIKVTVLKVTDDKVTFYDSLRLSLYNIKLLWKRCILFLNADENR